MTQEPVEGPAPKRVLVRCPLCGASVSLSLSVLPKLTATSSYEAFLTAEVGISGTTHHCPNIKGQTCST